MGGWSYSWQVLRKKELNGIYIYIFFFAKLYIDINVTLILHKKNFFWTFKYFF
jgi:hypothetical protein